MNTNRQTIEKMLESMGKEIKETMKNSQVRITMPNILAVEMAGEAVGLSIVKDKVKNLLMQNEYMNIFPVSELAKIDAQAIKDKQDKIKPPQIEKFNDEHKEGYTKGFYYGLDIGRGYISALIHLEVERENALKQKQQSQQQTRGIKR